MWTEPTDAKTAAEPRTEVSVDLGRGEVVLATVDPYSDRVRCDHPDVTNGAALGAALRGLASAHRAGRVVALVEADLTAPLAAQGYTVDAVVPGFYAGTRDCAVMALALDPERRVSCDAEAVARVESILEERRERLARPPVVSRRAEAADAPRIAALLRETFPQYPTPSDDPEYVAAQIEAGTPFRFIECDGDVVACASADLVSHARTAELTDCATRPTHRGRGLMRAILLDLMGDLNAMGYCSAFTMARAIEPGINVAFQRLGFSLNGRMTRSCRIGNGIEDMNVWSRPLVG